MGNFARQTAPWDTAGDPYWENVVLYTQFEADPPTDLSDSAHTFVEGAGYALDAATFKFGSGSGDLRGNGSTDWVEVADHADFEFGTAPFTMEIWVRHNDAGNNGILSKYGAAGQRSWNLEFVTSGDILQFSYSLDGTAEVIITRESVNVSTGVWTHYAIQRDENGIIVIFENGVPAMSTVETAAFHDGTAAVRVGTAVDGGGFPDYWADELRITKGVARYPNTGFTLQAGQFAVEAPSAVDYSDPYWDRVVLHTDFETKDVPVDNSPRKHTITLGSGASLETTNFKFGTTAVSFDETTNGYAEVADSDDWHFDDLDFTIETWVRWKTAAEANDTILSQYVTGGNQRSWLFDWQSTNLRVVYSSNGSGNSIFNAGTWTPTVDVWYHLAVCRSGADLRVFIDGVQSGSTHDISTTALFQSTAALRMGNRQDNFPADTIMDGVRITKGIARYTSDFIPPARAFPVTGSDQHYHSVTALVPLNQAAGSYVDLADRDENNAGAGNDTGVTTEVTAANLLFDDVVADVDNTDNGMVVVGDPYWDNVVLLCRMDHATPIDVSKSAHTLTVNSAVRDTTDKKFGASSFSFGTGTENISAADSADWDFGTGEFTVECWVYFDTAPGGGPDPAFVGQWDDTGDQAAWFLGMVNGDLRFSYSTNGSTNVITHEISPWTPGATTWYHLAVSRGSDNVIRMFVDGVEGNALFDNADFFDSTAAFHIGEQVSQAGTNHQRNIDDVRITKGVGRYPSSFTPPTRPHSSAEVIPTSGPFTMEGWVRWEADPATAASIIAGQWNEGEDERGWQVYLNNNQLRFSYSTDGAVGTVVNTDKAWNPVADQWYHWAITRDASDDMRWFIDGVQIGSTSNITATFHDSSAIVALGETEDHATGSTQIYLAQTKFTSGVARYVADFVMPQGPFATRGIDPRDLGNADLWYDASANGGIETDDNADVVTLFDLSGNGNHMANVTVSERPTVLAKSDANAIGGRRTLDFDGATQLLRVAVSDNRWDGADLPLTVAMVIQASTTPANDTSERFFSMHNTADADTQMAVGLGDVSGTDRWRITRDDDAGAGPTDVDDVTGADTNAHVVIVTFHGTTVDLLVDGTLEVNGTALDLGTLTVNEITLGAHNRNAVEGEHADFRLGELVLYDEALGDNAVAVLSNYLAAKWGI